MFLRLTDKFGYEIFVNPERIDYIEKMDGFSYVYLIGRNDEMEVTQTPEQIAIMMGVRVSDPPVEKDEDKLDIGELNLGNRTYNVLRHNGINRLSDITSMTREELASTRNMGKRSMEEIDNVLKLFNMKYRDEEKKDEG